MIPLEAVRWQTVLGQQSAKVRESRGSISLLMGAMTDEAVTRNVLSRAPAFQARVAEAGKMGMSFCVWWSSFWTFPQYAKEWRKEAAPQSLRAEVKPMGSLALRGALTAETKENECFRRDIKLFSLDAPEQRCLSVGEQSSRFRKRASMIRELSARILLCRPSYGTAL